jgi:hypothetical protein
LNSKNIQFLLAPLNLFSVDLYADVLLRNFERKFLCLNRAYLHYQIIDDIADMCEDTRQGIIGAPGAVLLSQATLARYVERFVGSDGARRDGSAEMVDAVTRSELLAGNLSNSPIFDEFRHRFGEELSAAGSVSADIPYVRCALANSETDLRKPLPELIKLRDAEGFGYLEALQAGKAESAQAWLVKSAVAKRLASAVGHDAAQIDLRRVVEEERSAAAIRILYLLEKLMRYTHRSARNVVNSPV